LIDLFFYDTNFYILIIFVAPLPIAIGTSAFCILFSTRPGPDNYPVIER
jgi:hypothetical protein